MALPSVLFNISIIYRIDRHASVTIKPTSSTNNLRPGLYFI